MCTHSKVLSNGLLEKRNSKEYSSWNTHTIKRNTLHGTLILSKGTQRKYSSWNTPIKIETLIITRNTHIIKRNTHHGTLILTLEEISLKGKGLFAQKRHASNMDFHYFIEYSSKGTLISAPLLTQLVTVMQVRKHLVENQWKQKRAKTLTSSVCTLHYMTCSAVQKCPPLKHFFQHDIMRHVLQHEITGSPRLHCFDEGQSPSINTFL